MVSTRMVQYKNGTVQAWYSTSMVQYKHGTVQEWYSTSMVQYKNGTVQEWYSTVHCGKRIQYQPNSYCTTLYTTWKITKTIIPGQAIKI